MDLAQAAFPGKMGRADRLAVILLNVAQGRRNLGQQGRVGIDLPLGFGFLSFLKPEQFQKKRPDQVIGAVAVIRTALAKLIQNPFCKRSQNLTAFRREKVCPLVDI